METFRIENNFGWGMTVLANNLEEALSPKLKEGDNFLTEGKFIKLAIRMSAKVEEVKIGTRILAAWTTRGTSRGTVEKIAKTKFHVSNSSSGNCSTLNIKGFLGIVELEK